MDQGPVPRDPGRDQDPRRVPSCPVPRDPGRDQDPRRVPSWPDWMDDPAYLTARAADDVFARQRLERQPVRAVLLVDVPKSAYGLGTEDERMPGTVAWTAPDGSTRTGRTLVDTGTKAGTRVVVWLDRQGRATTKPPSAGAAAMEAGVLGTAAGCALAGAVIGAGAVARWRLEQRRLGLWDREWTTVGPRWGHKTG